ncbi:type VII secretion protein EccB [Nonomuraea sp. SMC257]|uniref:Type VII secretion protein EccB n=1 Tax=Nonomuraea montanisoli TaxID=2741721 RepID=A0A7Y6I2E5_9ACTN|nr:type VII secretion protein EccB [Nonomuraea montanisoli]NUW30216.1 type VII secretion protein EccB [Nonomuraea montanisoli]
MQTRKDLYQAHRFMTQRLGMALLQGEPDLPESPMRRHNVATFAGVLIGILIAAGFGIYGMLKPGGATKLTDPGQLLVEEETGATYVYSEQESRLLPVANYVSARLLLDSDQVKVRNVSSESLAGFSRGPMVGIAGAPNSLPKPQRMVKTPWSACVTEGQDAAGTRRSYVTLVGGTEVGGVSPGAADALLVNDGGKNWVLWANQRMAVNNVDRLTDQAPRRVPLSWINSIPEGNRFAAPTITGRGRRLPGTSFRVGQVLKVDALAGSPARWYVLLSDGLAPITQTQATLLIQDPASQVAYGRNRVREIPIDAASANATKQSAQNIRGGGMPETMPRFQAPATSAPLCMVYADLLKGSVKGRLTVGSTVQIRAPKSTGSSDKFDQVVLPPGGAAVAGLLPGEGQLPSVTQFYLISDQGKKFRLVTPDVVTKLGYSAADVAPLPPLLLRLIPDGPALDPAAALTPMADTAGLRSSGS